LNNSPYAAKSSPEPTACEIARENGHKWTRLVGYTPAEATKRAKAAGWEGKVVVHESQEFDASCKDGTVCSFDPARWEIGDGYELTLKVNRKVSITTPD
jgi:beta-lactam-binding protein with PASTA domain